STPLLRGAAWVTLRDAALEGMLAPERYLEALRAAVADESEEVLTERLLADLSSTWWALLSEEARARLAPDMGAALWRGATGAPSATLRSAFLAASGRMALTPEATGRLARLWSGEEPSPVPLAESDLTQLAWALALREVDGW